MSDSWRLSQESKCSSPKFTPKCTLYHSLRSTLGWARITWTVVRVFRHFTYLPDGVPLYIKITILNIDWRIFCSSIFWRLRSCQNSTIDLLSHNKELNFPIDIQGGGDDINWGWQGEGMVWGIRWLLFTIKPLWERFVMKIHILIWLVLKMSQCHLHLHHLSCTLCSAQA